MGACDGAEQRPPRRPWWVRFGIQVYSSAMMEEDALKRMMGPGSVGPGGRTGLEGREMERRRRETKERAAFVGRGLRCLLLLLSGLLLAAGALGLGVGAWVVVEKRGVEWIVGSNLYTSSALMLVGVGAVGVALAGLGAAAAWQRLRCLLLVHLVCVLVLFLLALVAAVLGFVFTSYLPLTLQESMVRSLRSHYGQQGFRSDQWVTEAWDYTQKTLECCGVHGEADWAHSAVVREAGPALWPSLVPESCCRRGADRRPLSAEFCRGHSERSRRLFPYYDFLHHQYGCCGIADGGSGEEAVEAGGGIRVNSFWAWQNSSWFKGQTSFPQEKVPRSCCITCAQLFARGYCHSDPRENDETQAKICHEHCPQPSGDFVDQDRCQGTSAESRLLWPQDVYLHTNGCYEPLVREMGRTGRLLGSVGTCLAVLLLLSTLTAMCLYRFSPSV